MFGCLCQTPGSDTKLAPSSRLECLWIAQVIQGWPLVFSQNGVFLCPFDQDMKVFQGTSCKSVGGSSDCLPLTGSKLLLLSPFPLWSCNKNLCFAVSSFRWENALQAYCCDSCRFLNPYTEILTYFVSTEMFLPFRKTVLGKKKKKA